CFMLCFARRIPWLTSELKAGRWTPLDGTTLAECTLGVIGAGNIGSAVLRKASAFGMKLLVHDTARELPLQLMDDTRCERVPLDDLLRASDFVSLNCDLNPTSHHLINQETLRLMRPSAVLINTARGGCVDEPALVDALRSGAIGGAGLDVFAEEPIPQSSPLRDLDNVLLSPHLANSSDRAAHRVHRITLSNICEMLRASASGGSFTQTPANGGPH
ncbi:MAG: NAD(P)-dependent oxidoreductase, partial [Planctomycetota bacterium]